MRMPPTSGPIVIVALLVSLAVASHSAPSSQEDILTRSVVGSVNGPRPASKAFAGAREAFVAALRAADVAGGAIVVEGCPEEPKHSVQISGTTLGELLNSIAGSDPHYAWRLYRGVVDLEPSGGLPALLTTQLKAYDSGDATDPESAVTFLNSLPEVMRAAVALGLTQNPSGSFLSGMAPGPPPPRKRLDLRLHDITLLDALNAIARTNKHGFWTYNETHCGSINQFSLYFAE